MSTRKWLVAGAAGDLADVPFLDDAERAESRWLIGARGATPARRHPSAKLAADYAELEDLLGNLPLGASDESWQDEVLRTGLRLGTPLRPWWRRTIFRWAMGGALARGRDGVGVWC